MTGGITYRAGTLADGTDLLRLHCRAIAEVGARAYGEEVARSWAHGLSAEGYGQSMSKGEAFEVAVADCRPVGFCGAKGEEICGLYVDPDHMRRGIASTLLRNAFEHQRALGFDRSFVTATLIAVPFYERHGFRRLAERLMRTRGGLDMRVVDMERPLTV